MGRHILPRNLFDTRDCFAARFGSLLVRARSARQVDITVQTNIPQIYDRLAVTTGRFQRDLEIDASQTSAIQAFDSIVENTFKNMAMTVRLENRPEYGSFAEAFVTHMRSLPALRFHLWVHLHSECLSRCCERSVDVVEQSYEFKLLLW